MSQIELLASVRAFLAKEYGCYIDGQWSPCAAETLPVFDPSTGGVIARVGEATPADVDRAVRSAHRAFSSGVWSNKSPAERERILLRYADLLEANGEELAQLETLEQGKSINISRMFEVGATLNWMRYVAGLTTKHDGRSMELSIAFPPGARYTAYTRKEPIGVVAGIVPWNFPLMIGMWKVMPALAAGCTVVVKPSEVTPLTLMRMVELAGEAGIPPGVLNLVNGRGLGTGQALTEHPLISKVSFTGSTATGKAIARSAADRLLRVTLELGGKNPAIVLADADPAQVIEGLMAGSFLNQGQVCAASSRVYIEAPLFDRLVGDFELAVKSLTLGPGLDPAAQINPLVSKGHQEKVLGYLAEAGSEVIQGQVAPAQGYYVSPSLLINPSDGFRLVREEVFGPVLNLIRVKDAEEALAKANDSDLGLTASLWTQNFNQAMNLTPRIQAGTVWVNSHTVIDANMPFGGYKQSGLGRDFGVDWLDAYCETKSVCLRH
ncbi:aldehyde dehydrogenase family protein [Pseudomonas sp. CR3202]|uniref:aldehyde dehydrogenase family protein n=1 Tax=Pseudomonas sp. CR3202 TaxID=3351532 RepID=UPI003BF42A9D